MNDALVDQVARAVLYEGYILYPYRPAVKNRQRWTFGGLFPRSYSLDHGSSDPWSMQTQCLLRGDPPTVLEVKVRFLHLMVRLMGELSPPLDQLPPGGEPPFCIVEALRVGERLFHTWQEAVEREVAAGERSLAELQARPQQIRFAFPYRRELEPLPNSDGKLVGVIVREQQAIDGTVEISTDQVADGVFRVTVKVMNQTPLEKENALSREQAQLHSLASTHTILGVRGGELFSLLDPPEQWRAIASACQNIGTWPVLVGEEGGSDTMLSAPITLYDYPRIAPESPGDFFDGTEIDEMLTLRILTLTDEEKQVMEAVDDQTRELLHRTESLAREQLAQLHGTIRSFQPVEGDNHG
jgi:hydrogenase maturation protease